MVMRPLLFLLTIPLAVGILFPLGALVGEAFSGTTSAGDVLGMLLSPPMLRAVGNTLWVGGLTALLSTVLGGILAYTMTLTKAPGRKALGWLFMAPLLAPSFMPAMGLVYLFGNYGLLFPTQLYGVPGLRTCGIEVGDSRRRLESRTGEGKSPVGEIKDERRVSRVPQDTSNPVGRRGAHPPRLNTTW